MKNNTYIVIIFSILDVCPVYISLLVIAKVQSHVN